MKKLLAGAIVASFLFMGVGCGDSHTTTKTTEMKGSSTAKSTEVKEAPK